MVFSGYACKFAKYKYCTLRPYFQRYGIVRDVYGAENGTPHLADLGVHREKTDKTETEIEFDCLRMLATTSYTSGFGFDDDLESQGSGDDGMGCRSGRQQGIAANASGSSKDNFCGHLESRTLAMKKKVYPTKSSAIAEASFSANDSSSGRFVDGENEGVMIPTHGPKRVR